MILFKCDWCGCVEPAGPSYKLPPGWKHIRYRPKHFCGKECLVHWQKHRRWQKAKKRPRAKAV